ncbi:MAG: aquaporin family protein [Flavobacteriales bacterium]|nr:aquaporin family protein [Flavobacteriales bacterium]
MRSFLGEVIGTFVLVAIGTSSVAVAVLYNALNLYAVAAIWAIGVSLGIYASQKWSHSHLNPAVSLAFLFRGKITFRQFFIYLPAQFVGAFLAAVLVYLIFSNAIVLQEGNNLTEQTAMIFGEFYPNPANKALFGFSTFGAFLLEGGGTFVLILFIFSLDKVKLGSERLHPILIGVLVGILIILIAPYTQCGINPARDFAPRLFSFLSGWQGTAFDLPQYGWLTVYVAAPFLGAVLAAICSRIFRFS